MKVDKVSLIMNRNIDLLLYQKLKTLKYRRSRKNSKLQNRRHFYQIFISKKHLKED